MTVRSNAILFIILCAAAVTGAQSSDLVVRDAWIREGEPQSTSAGYFVLQNRGAAPVRLVAAEVEGVGIVEMHEMKVAGDMMRMAKIDGLDVPAGATVAFNPGGLHLMLLQLKHAFRPGATASVTLRFSNGSSVKVQASVRKKSEMGA